MPKNKLKLRTKRTYDPHFDEGHINNDNLDEYLDDLNKLETNKWQSIKSNSPMEKLK